MPDEDGKLPPLSGLLRRRVPAPSREQQPASEEHAAQQVPGWDPWRQLTPTVRRVDLSDDGTRAAVVAIYEEAFPAVERMDSHELVASVQAGERECYVAERDGVVLGFAITLRLQRPSLTYLDYLAADQHTRSGGVGGVLVDHLREAGRTGPTPSNGVLLEIEPLDEATGPEDRGMRMRRIAFYEKHGGSVLDCPDWRGWTEYGKGQPVRYSLIWLPSDRGRPLPQGATLRDMLTRLYTTKYPDKALPPFLDTSPGLNS